MKFCHIEESGGQQVLFRVNVIDIIEFVNIWAETFFEGNLVSKIVFTGSQEQCLEYFNTLDFQKEAYNFLTEVASCM